MSALLGLLLLSLVSQSAFSLKFTSNKIYTLENVDPAFIGRVIEAELNTTVECLRYILETGLPEYNIPSLVTVDIPEITINPEDFGPNSSGFFTGSGLLKGLTTFYSPAITTSLSLTPIGFVIDITLVFQQIYIDLDYDMNLIIEGIQAYGNGEITIDWTDLTIRLQFFLGLSDTVYIADLAVYLYVGNSQVKITGWFNDEAHSEAISDLVNDYLLPHWINAQPDDISDTISPLLETLINELIVSGLGEEGGIDLETILEEVAVLCEGAAGKGAIMENVW